MSSHIKSFGGKFAVMSPIIEQDQKKKHSTIPIKVTKRKRQPRSKETNISTFSPESEEDPFQTDVESDETFSEPSQICSSSSELDVIIKKYKKKIPIGKKLKKRRSKSELILSNVAKEHSNSLVEFEQPRKESKLRKVQRKTYSTSNQQKEQLTDYGRCEKFVLNIKTLLDEVNSKINILSKSTAKLQQEIALYRHMPNVPTRAVYSLESPPIGVDNKQFTAFEKTVIVPARNENDVFLLNEILGEKKTFQEVVSNLNH